MTCGGANEDSQHLQTATERLRARRRGYRHELRLAATNDQKTEQNVRNSHLTAGSTRDGDVTPQPHLRWFPARVLGGGGEPRRSPPGEEASSELRAVFPRTQTNGIQSQT